MNWLDITTCSSWNRPPVGIIRVELEAINFALKYKQNTKFCVFDKQKKFFYEIKKKEVENLVKNLILLRYQNSDIKASSRYYRKFVYFSRMILFHLFRDKDKTLENKLKKYKPFVINSYLNLKRVCLEVIIAINCIYKFFFVEGRKRATKNYQELVFKKDDVYISMGLDWDKKDLKYIFNEKKKYGFKVNFFCYDIIPILFPHLCSGNISPIFIDYYIDLAHLSDQVFCISKNTKADLIKFWNSVGAPIKPTSVVRLGDTEIFSSQKADYKFNNLHLNHFIKSDFILLVSTIERRKNHEIIYRAYTRLIDKGYKEKLPNLIFVGMRGWGVNDFFDDLKYDLRVKDKIFVFNNISDVDLSELYKRCLFTVYPSLYEGWGLPVAESLSYGKFCLATNSSSVPEITSNIDCIKFIDPWDISGWEKAIFFYSTNKSELIQKELLIKKNYKRTSWRQTFAKVFK
jgi:glycosyltransferase involved in cell wall biosynthesis